MAPWVDPSGVELRAHFATPTLNKFAVAYRRYEQSYPADKNWACLIGSSNDGFGTLTEQEAMTWSKLVAVSDSIEADVLSALRSSIIPTEQ